MPTKSTSQNRAVFYEGKSKRTRTILVETKDCIKNDKQRYSIQTFLEEIRSNWWR